MAGFADNVRAEWPEKSDQILGLIKGRIDPESFEPVATWIRQCYHRPSRHELIACAINVVIEGFGVEAIFSQRSCTQPYAEYVNLGDTYTTTLVYLLGSERWRVASWGDVVEAAERKGIRFD